MEITIRKYTVNDLPQMLVIWNEVVENGIAFPQLDKLTKTSGQDFFAEQSFAAVAESLDNREIIGLYVLHPNNVGRCAHLANASYAIKTSARGLHFGEQLVAHSLKKAKKLGFKIMQFNAVVKSNYAAIRIYEKLGFIRLGIIPGGFKMKSGYYEDIILYYYVL